MPESKTQSLARGQYERVHTSEESFNASAHADHPDPSSTHDNISERLRTSFSYPAREQALSDSSGNDNELDTFTAATVISPRWPRFPPQLDKGRSRRGPPSPLVFAEEVDESTAGLLNDESNAAQLSAVTISPTWARTGKRTIGWLIWPLPSFTHRFFGVRYPAEPRRSTDYLDGMRGVASLFVFFAHYLLGVHDRFVHEGYAYSDNWNFFQLPFIRTIYAGSAMVAIFFVISGYVLSQRCVIAMRNHQHDKLYAALASMTFRRGIRLFLPSVVIMSTTCTLVLLGLHTSEFPEGWNWGVEFRNFRYHLFEDLFNLWYWEAVWIDNWYAPQLWTIPVEYRCSMLLFVLILMVSRTKTIARYAIEGITMAYLFYAKRWDAALFVAGLVIAELRLAMDARKELREKIESSNESATGFDLQEKRERWYHLRMSHIPLWILLIVGFYLTGYPDFQAKETPGYDFLTKIWTGDDEPKFRFWLAQSAIFVVVSVAFLPNAQAFFSTSIARYLGKISYALYLVHQLMNRTVRVAIWGMFWNVLHYEKENGQKGLRFEGGWILGGLVYIPLVIWAADVFWRAVDVPTVKFAKWLESKCSIQNQDR